MFSSNSNASSNLNCQVPQIRSPSSAFQILKNCLDLINQIPSSEAFQISFCKSPILKNISASTRSGSPSWDLEPTKESKEIEWKEQIEEIKEVGVSNKYIGHNE